MNQTPIDPVEAVRKYVRIPVLTPGLPEAAEAVRFPLNDTTVVRTYREVIADLAVQVATLNERLADRDGLNYAQAGTIELLEKRVATLSAGQNRATAEVERLRAVVSNVASRINSGRIAPAEIAEYCTFHLERSVAALTPTPAPSGEQDTAEGE